MSIITMTDVAKAAKVSRATASMVLNGCSEKWRISDGTRRRVIETAKHLGYRKNLVARAMVTGKTDVIGIIGTLDNSYGSSILRGISEIVGNTYSIKYFRGKSENELMEIAGDCVRQRLSGVICHLDDFSLPVSHELSTAEIPMVHVDNCFAGGSFSSIGSDDFTGAVQVVEYLYSIGHRQIAHITGDLVHTYGKVRYDGFLAGLEQHGLKFANNLLGIADLNVEVTDNFRGMVMAIIRSGATAVFCGGDPQAMRTLKVVIESGITVPDELSIVGFAGLDYTQWSVPALTTVRQPFVEMGREAAKVLMSEIKDGTPCRQVKLPVELLIRQSTARVPQKNLRHKAETKK